MGGRVDQKRRVQAHHVAKRSGDPQAIPEGLSPPEMGEGRGKHEAHEQGQRSTVLALEHDDGVTFKVRQVDLPSCFQYLEHRRRVGGGWHGGAHVATVCD